MSALSRCARYARVFSRSLHSYSRNTAIQLPKSEINIVKSHKNSFCLGPGISKRLYTTTKAESTKEQDDVPIESKRQLQESKQKFTCSEEYPASVFWKNYDYSKTRKLYDFQSACKNIYFAMTSQRGISASEFHVFMSLVEQRDDFTDDEVKLILKSVGFLNKEVNKEDKVRWTEYLTRRFIFLGVHLDVTYYNQVLRNYLQMNHIFSPVEYMSTMEKHGVAPNGVTLSRFVVAYCKAGDIKSASQVLEHMRSREMSINARVYNNLILGNFLAGDKNTAMKLFRDAGEMGFQMDASLYYAAIVGHAMMGDLDGVKTLVQEASDNMVVFSDGAFSAMIEQVAPKGRQDIIDYFLDLLTKSSTFYYNESLDSMPALMAQGYYEVAYKYFRSLSDPSGRLFYKAALLTNMGPEDVVKYSRLMKEDDIRDSSLLEYYALAIIKYLHEPAIAILPHIKAEGEPLRQHMLWPLIQYYKIMEDSEGLQKILPHWNGTDASRTLYYLESSAKQFKLTHEEYKDILKKHSVLTEGQVNACMVHMLTGSSWKSAAEYAKTCGRVEDLIEEGEDLLGARLMQGVTDKNCEYVIEILASIRNASPVIENWVIRNAVSKAPNLEEVKKLMLEKKIQVGDNVLPKSFKELFTEEELSEVTRKRLTMEEMKKMSLKELLAAESYLSNNLLFKVCLLDKSYKAQNWEVYDRTLQSTNVTDLHSLPNIVFQAARFYLQNRANVSKCLKTMEYLQSNYPRFMPPMSLMFTMAGAMCQQGRHVDAVKFLSLYNYHEREPYDVGYVNIKTIFSMEPVPENIRLASRILEAFSENGYLRKMRLILGAYWNFISSCGDLEASLEAFEMLKQQHNYVPSDFGILFGHFIREGDKSSLQAAYDKFTDVVIEQRVLLSLMAAFVENGQIENAKKTLKTPGMRIMSDDFRNICRRWAAEGKVELIEEFTKLVGNLPGHIKNSEIILFKLKAMCNKPNPNVDAVIRFFESQFDEEELEANIDACKLYASFLRQHNREVPFDKFMLDLIDGKMRQQNIQQTESRRNREPVKKESVTQNTQDKQTKQSVTDSRAENSKTQLTQSESKFPPPLSVCKKLSTAELKQMLPDDLPLLTKWAESLMSKYHIRELECIPSDTLHQILNGQFDGKKEGDELNWSCSKWRILLDKVPDVVLSRLPKMHLKDQTWCFAASLYTNDIEKVKAVKNLIENSEGIKFVHETINRTKQVQDTFKVDQSKKRDLFFTLIDSINSEKTQAFAMSHALSNFSKGGDVDGAEMLSEKVASNGLTFEKVTELLPSSIARGVFMSVIQDFEEKFNSQNKSLPWEPLCNWSIKVESDVAQAKTTDISTEKAVTDVAIEIEEKTEVAVAKDTPVDVTVAVKDTTEVLSVKKDADEIVDIAKTIRGEAELEMKDKASVVSDQSVEIDTKSGVAKDKSS